MMRTCLLIVLWLSAALPAFGQISDAEIREKTRNVNQALRCVVCQNQNIDESDAPLAADMRNLVRRKISQGESEEAVIAYMRETYGDYVLLKPPVQRNTLILWFGPLLLIGAMLIWLLRTAHKSQTDSA